MKRILIAIAIATTATFAPVAAFAGEDGGHGGSMDDHGGMDEHGGGGSSHTNTPTATGAREIDVTAGRFRFKPNEITVGAGEDVTIVLSSKDLFHDFFVKGTGHVVGAKAKKTKKGGLMIEEPGTYKFWCTVEGHRAAGMKGTIVVQ